MCPSPTFTTNDVSGVHTPVRPAPRSTSAAPSVSNPALSDFSGPTADRPALVPGSHTTRRSARPAAPRAARATGAATRAISIASRPASTTTSLPRWPPDQADKALRLLEELVPAGADPARSSPTSIDQDLAPLSEPRAFRFRGGSGLQIDLGRAGSPYDLPAAFTGTGVKRGCYSSPIRPARPL